MTGRRRSQGEGSVYRRASDGLWVGLADLGWAQGKRRRKAVYGKTEREVRSKLAETRRAAQRGVDVFAHRRTVEQWLTEWLSDIKTTDGTRPTTLRMYRWVIFEHITPVVGGVQLDKLTPADVRGLVATKAKEGLAPATVRHIHGVLRNALSDAERLDLIGRNVAKAVRAPSVPHVEIRGLTTAEARRLLDVIRDDRLYPLFLLLLTLGLRRGEGLGLGWADVDFDAGTLRVRQTLQRVDGRLQLMQPKTSRSARTVPVPRQTVDVLAAHRRRQTVERTEAALLGRKWPTPNLVFVSTTGTPLEPRNVNRRWHELRQQAGLPWLRIHDLRHACASILLVQGVPARVVMELLGHSTIQLTMNTYTHVMPQLQRDAATAMELALFERDA